MYSLRLIVFDMYDAKRLHTSITKIYIQLPDDGNSANNSLIAGLKLDY